MSDNPIILVDFDDERGSARGVSRGESLADKSEAAVKRSLRSIEWVGQELKEVLDKLHDRPDTVELEFGIKVSTEAGVLVKGSGEAHIKAKLVWHKDTASDTDSGSEESADDA